MPGCCAVDPSPDFDLDLALHSLHRFAERRPTAWPWPTTGSWRIRWTCSTRPTERCGSWVDVAESAFHRGEDIAAALDAAFASDLDGVPEVHREKLDVMNGVHSNAAGLHRWLSTGSPARTTYPAGRSRLARSETDRVGWPPTARPREHLARSGWVPVVVRAAWPSVLVVAAVDWRSGRMAASAGLGSADRRRGHRRGGPGRSRSASLVPSECPGDRLCWGFLFVVAVWVAVIGWGGRPPVAPGGSRWRVVLALLATLDHRPAGRTRSPPSAAWSPWTPRTSS